MKEARAPEGGYNFPEKAIYRHKIWFTFEQNITKPVEEAVVLFMPSKEGLEIPIALGYGFKEENLIAMDDSPQLLATAPWRKTHPKIKIYGSEIQRASERMAADGIKLDAANLDLCGNFSTPMLRGVTSFIESGVMNDPGLVSITMRNGREDAEMSAVLGVIKDLIACMSDDTIRTNILMSVACDNSGTIYEMVENGKYLSGGIVPMVWTIYRTSSQQSIFECRKNEHIKLVKEIYPHIQKINELLGNLKTPDIISADDGERVPFANISHMLSNIRVEHGFMFREVRGDVLVEETERQMLKDGILGCIDIHIEQIKAMKIIMQHPEYTNMVMREAKEKFCKNIASFDIKYMLAKKYPYIRHTLEWTPQQQWRTSNKKDDVHWGVGLCLTFSKQVRGLIPNVFEYITSNGIDLQNMEFMMYPYDLHFLKDFYLYYANVILGKSISEAKCFAKGKGKETTYILRATEEGYIV